MKKQYDVRFEKLLDYIFKDEGGFVDDPDDRGGRTNYGITQGSYNDYRDRKGIGKADVKNITKVEAKNIYYEDYYKRSGADKQKDIKDAYILFDTAVNFHPVTAKIMFKQASYDFYKMIELRKDIHIQEAKNPNQSKYLNGWLNRVDKIEKRAEELYREEIQNSTYKREITPALNSIMKNTNKINENEKLQNKLFYYMNKNKNTLDSYDPRYRTHINNIIFADEDVSKLTSREFSEVEHIINNQLENNRFLSKKEAENLVQSGDLIWVNEYVRDDGTKVKGHYRTKAS